MTFEEAMISKYKAVFGGRLFWDSIPSAWGRDSMVQPFGLMYGISGQERIYIDNTQHDFLNMRVQFEVWGDNRIPVSEKMRELAAAVVASNTADWIARPEGGQGNDFNEVLKLRGSRQDFVFWYKNPVAVE